MKIDVIDANYEKTWTLKLTEEQIIALAKACCGWQEMMIASGHMSLEDLNTLSYINDISEKLPDEDWFSEEVRP